MGTEIVFVLILPIAVVCLSAAVFFWSSVAKIGWAGKRGPLKAYAPLFAGFLASMTAVAILSYIESHALFTYLIEQGYYTEAQRALYLPRRVAGHAIVQLIFLLPIIAFVVVPLTAWLIRADRLTLKAIGLFAVSGWVALLLLGWLLNLATSTPSYPMPTFLTSTAIPVLLYGLPIPLAAFLLLRSERIA